MKATDTQVGGTHYKDMPIQPIDFITKNNIPYIEGNIIKYLCRWKSKNGVEDLKKAKHYLEMLIDMQFPKVELSSNPKTGSYWYEANIDFDWKELDAKVAKKKPAPKKAAKKK
jgi:hypothetical protein